MRDAAGRAVVREQLAGAARAAMGGGRRLEAVERVVDREGTHGPAELAIVEDIPGESPEHLLARDPSAAAPVMERPGEALEAMGRHRASTYGKVAVVDGGGTSQGTPCEDVVLDRALRDLAEAASCDPRIAKARGRLEERPADLAAAVRPRAEYAVVHGELGPDHVPVDAAGYPVAIDIEGSMYFDVEWEHVFLRIRLHDAYRSLAVDGLDENRLALCTLARRLSLTAGPLRQLDGGFPHRAAMADIAEHNSGGGAGPGPRPAPRISRGPGDPASSPNRASAGACGRLLRGRT